jgi:hypothetical protein
MTADSLPIMEDLTTAMRVAARHLAAMDRPAKQIRVMLQQMTADSSAKCTRSSRSRSSGYAPSLKVMVSPRDSRRSTR